MKGIMKSYVISPVNLTEAETDLFPNTLSSYKKVKVKVMQSR
jgi:hypothetical protein